MSDFLNWLDTIKFLQEDRWEHAVFILAIIAIAILVFLISWGFSKLKLRKLTPLGPRKTWWWRHICDYRND